MMRLWRLHNWVLDRAAVGCLLLLAMLILSSPAHATLGGGIESVARDRDALQGTLHSVPEQSYDMHEILSASGATVREYAPPGGGDIFAVTWSGAQAPDLRLLLGTYFDRYVAAAKLHRRGHHELSIDTPDLVMTVVRFQRYVSGQVYLPSLMPRGVTRRELR